MTGSAAFDLEGLGLTVFVGDVCLLLLAIKIL